MMVVLLLLVGTGFLCVVENGGRIIYDNNIGVGTQFWGKVNLWNIQGVLGYCRLWEKVCPIRFGDLRNQTIIRQTSGPSLSRLSY